MTEDPYLRPSAALQNAQDVDDVATLPRLDANAALRGAMVLFCRPAVVPATWDVNDMRGIHQLVALRSAHVGEREASAACRVLDDGHARS